MLPPRYVAQDGLCFYCERSMEPGPYHRHKLPRGYTKDHLVPVSRGGRDSPKVLACQQCNNRKGDRLPSEAELAKYFALYGIEQAPFVLHLLKEASDA